MINVDKPELDFNTCDECCGQSDVQIRTGTDSDEDRALLVLCTKCADNLIIKISRFIADIKF